MSKLVIIYRSAKTSCVQRVNKFWWTTSVDEHVTIRNHASTSVNIATIEDKATDHDPLLSKPILINCFLVLSKLKPIGAYARQGIPHYIYNFGHQMLSIHCHQAPIYLCLFSPIN